MSLITCQIVNRRMITIGFTYCYIRHICMRHTNPLYEPDESVCYVGYMLNNFATFHVCCTHAFVFSWQNRLAVFWYFYFNEILLENCNNMSYKLSFDRNVDVMIA